MLSIRSALAYHGGHLPKDWTPALGLRALFPDGYGGSISPLRNYAVMAYCRLATQGYASNQGDTFETPSCAGHFWVAADGGGRWFFGWIYGRSFYSDVYPRQGGFVFKSPINGMCLGYVDTSRPRSLTISCNAGTDQTLKDNWPQMLAGGSGLVQAFAENLVFIMFQLESDPDPAAVWTGAGFAKAAFTQLTGSHVAAEGDASGSTLFAFPGSVPANALQPPAISDPSTRSPEPDGSGGGAPDDSPSYTTLDPPGPADDPFGDPPGGI